MRRVRMQRRNQSLVGTLVERTTRSVVLVKLDDGIAEMLNARPRKSLGWKAPAKPFLPKGTFNFQTFRSARAVLLQVYSET